MDPGPPGEPGGSSPGPLYRSAWLFYLILASVGLVWLGWHRGDLDPTFFLPFPGGWIDLLLGVATALLLVGSWRVGRVFLTTMADLERTMAAIIGPLDGSQAFVLAFISGFAEEVFFRGAMMSSWGWIWATLIFALMHAGPGRELRVWTVFALLAGLVLAGLTQLRGNLLAPMVAHFLVNWIQLRYLSSLRISEAAPGEG